MTDSSKYSNQVNYLMQKLQTTPDNFIKTQILGEIARRTIDEIQNISMQKSTTSSSSKTMSVIDQSTHHPALNSQSQSASFMNSQAPIDSNHDSHLYDQPLSQSRHAAKIAQSKPKLIDPKLENKTVYHCERLQAGCNLTNKNKNKIHLNERMTLKLHLGDDALIKIEKNKNNPEKNFYRVIRESTTKNNKYIRFRYCLIERSDQPDRSEYMVTESLLDGKITFNKKSQSPFSYYIPNVLSEKYHLKPDMLVDIAGKNPEIFATIQPIVTLVHDDSEFETSKIEQTIKNHPKYKTRNVKHDYRPRLNFKFEKQLHVLVVGYGEHFNEIKDAVECHNAIATSYDKKDANIYSSAARSAVKNNDIVIGIISSASHDLINSINTISKDYDIKFAISDQGSPLAIEKALYRAYKELPANDQQSSIPYPIK